MHFWSESNAAVEGFPGSQVKLLYIFVPVEQNPNSLWQPKPIFDPDVQYK
jgi:hypothetical protein